MNCLSRLLSVILITGFSYQHVLAERLDHPVRSPSTGVLPIVDGVASLTVAGTNYWQRYRFEDGEQPQLSAVYPSGETLPDGYYRYELKSKPLQSVSESKHIFFFGKSKSQQKRVKTVRGRFEVIEGQIFPQ